MTVFKKDPLQADGLGSYTFDVLQGIDKIDLSETLGIAHEMVVQDTRDAFNASMSQEGDAWPARKKEGDGHPLLMDTGKLLQAATGGGEGHIDETNQREATFGIDADVVPYAAVHQMGGGNNIPERKYFGATEKTEEAVGELIADHMLEVF